MPEPPISDSDVERMKRGIERFNQGDFDALRELISPDVVMERVRVVDEHPVVGWEALRAFLEPDVFEWQRYSPLDWTVNHDKVLVHMRIQSRGAGSGVELEVEGWMVWTVADGVVVHMANFVAGEEAEARAAAGLGQNASP